MARKFSANYSTTTIEGNLNLARLICIIALAPETSSARPWLIIHLVRNWVFFFGIRPSFQRYRHLEEKFDENIDQLFASGGKGLYQMYHVVLVRYAAHATASG